MFFNKNKTKSKSKITSLLIGLGLYSLLNPTTTTHAEGNSGYILGIAPDFNRFMYQTTVGTEVHNWNHENYSEFDAILMNSTVIRDMKIPSTLDQAAWDISKSNKKIIDGEEVKVKDCRDKKKCTMFLFPANTSNAAANGPTQKDSEAINRVTSQVVSQLNQAISFIYTNGTKDGIPLVAQDLSMNERKEWFFKITSELGNKTIAMQDDGEGTAKTKLEIPGLDNTFYVKKKSAKSSYLILSTGDKEIELRFRILKYPDGTVSGSDDEDRGGEYRTIFWTHIVWWGNANYVHRQIDATVIADLVDQGLVAKHLYNLLDLALNGLRSILQIQPVSDILFNQGNYANTNWRGIAPIEWFEAGNILMWICQIIAWLSLALALVWRFGSTMWGTVTTFKYVTLVQSIKDIFTASISTALIYPFFMLLTNFNVLLVDIMANLTIFNDHIDTRGVGGGTIAGILVSILFFGVEIYFNFTYLLRGVTIVLLYGLAPMFFMVYAFGGGFQTITMRYVKELVGNIFIHTFHATFLAFFAIFINTANAGIFAQLVLLYAFVPMTKLFKTLTGIGEADFISSTADQAKDNIKAAGTAVAGGVIGGAIGGMAAGKMKGQKGGDGKNGGGGGGGSYQGDSLADNFGGDTSKKSLAGNIGNTIKKKVGNLPGANTARKIAQRGQNVIDSAKGKMNPTVAKYGGKLAKGTGNLIKKGGKSLYNGNANKLLKGAAKTAGGAALAASGALLGNGQLMSAGSKTMQSGLKDGINGTAGMATNFATNLTDTISEKMTDLNNKGSEFAQISGYDNGDGTRTDKFDGDKLKEIGIEEMATGKDESGKDVLRQKINPSKLNPEVKDYLDNLKTDDNGNVDFSSMDKEIKGLTNLKKTADGKYVASFDLNKIALNSVKKSGGNYIVNQNNRQSGTVSQAFITDFVQKTPARPKSQQRARVQQPVQVQEQSQAKK